MTRISTIIILLLLPYVGKLYGQISKSANSIEDSFKIRQEQEILKEHIQRQQNRVLHLNDSIPKIEEKETLNNDINQKLKFIILCFNLSKSYEDEIISLNKIAKEYEKHVSSLVIKAEDLNKYNEVFTKKEYKSLQEFILNKSEAQKRSTSFPVILILDKNGQILNAWSGDKTEDGLKSYDYYNKIKAGLESISKKN